MTDTDTQLRAEARDYWQRRPLSGQLFRTDMPWHQDMAVAVADLVDDMDEPAILEFGCGGGANLAAIRTLVPDAVLVGLDLNRLQVTAGKAEFGLDLRVGDEDSLGKLLQAGRHFDVAFTLSVLDHMPDPGLALEPLVELADVVVLVEPWSGKAEQLTHYPNGIASRSLTWSHDLPAALRKLGMSTDTVASPTVPRNNGPLYRRTVARKKA